jgi:ribosomal protein S18 acetylase RimI-like enzyme
MENFNLRHLTPDDSAWVREFWTEHWGSELMVVNGETFHAAGLPGFVVEQAGRVIGLATYCLEKTSCKLLSLDSLVEGQGVGTALLEAVIEAARLAGCRRFSLVTTNDNLSALRFYQRRGFRLTNLRPGAVDEARKIKPSIPLTGEHGIPIRDELEMETDL